MALAVWPVYKQKETARKAVHAFQNMLRPGNAKKVSIHLNEDTVATTDFLYNEIFSFLYARGVAGATLLRPQAGFGSHHRIHDAEEPGDTHQHMPVRIEFIESAETVDALMPELCRLVSDGLVEAQDTTIYRIASAGQARQ